MDNRELISTYVDFVEDIYINSTSAISLIYSLINTSNQRYLGRENFTSWNRLKNVDIENLSIKENLNLIDKKNYIKSFLYEQFENISSRKNWNWSFAAKTNFLTIIIDWLGGYVNSGTGIECIDADGKEMYQRMKRLEECVAKSNEILEVLEYTQAFIRDFDFSLVDNEGNELYLFSLLIDDEINRVMTEIKEFEIKSSNTVTYSLKNSFGGIKDTLSSKEESIFSKAMALGFGALNPGYHIAVMAGAKKDKEMDINCLMDLSKTRLFLACGYIIIRLSALAFTAPSDDDYQEDDDYCNDNNQDEYTTNDDFNFDNI